MEDPQGHVAVRGSPVWLALWAVGVGVVGLLLMEVPIVRWIGVVLPVLGILAFARVAAGPLAPKRGVVFGLLCGLPLAVQFLTAAPDMIASIQQNIQLARTRPVTYLETRAEALKAENRPRSDPEQSRILTDLALLKSGQNQQEMTRITTDLARAADTAEKNLWLTMGLGAFFPLLPFALLGLAGSWISRRLDLRPARASKKLHPAAPSL